MYNDPYTLAVVRVVFQELLRIKPNVQFSKYFDVSGGYAFKSSQYSSSGIFILRVTNIEPDGSINKSDAKYISEKSVDKNLKNFELLNNDVLMVMVGGSIGKVGIVTPSILPALLNQNLWKIENPKRVCHKYIFYLCLYLKEFSAAKASSTHGHFSRTEFRELLIPDLSKSETESIARFIDSIISDNEILGNVLLQNKTNLLSKIILTNNISRKIEVENSFQQTHLQQLRQAILQEAVQGKLTKQDPNDEPAEKLLQRIKAEKQQLIAAGKLKKEKELPPITEDEVPFELPKGWVWCRLGEIGITQTGATPSTGKREFFGDYIPFIGPGDISDGIVNYNNNGLSKLGIEKARLIQANSILMVCIGGSIGKSFINDREVTCNQQINTITPLGDLLIKYLFYALTSPYFQSEVASKATGSATPIINKGKWETILIPLPPLAEQQRIVTKVEQLMQMVNELEQQVQQSKEQAEQLLQAVLKEAFSKPSVTKMYEENEVVRMVAEE